MKYSSKSYLLVLFPLLMSLFLMFAGTYPLLGSNDDWKHGQKVEGKVEFDKLLHDFGDILLSEGAVSCDYQVKNISEKPVVIYNVVSSCGCTEVKWTRKPLKKGEIGKIHVVFDNNQGAFPFDKMLTVYISGLKKPVILRLRGVSHKKKLKLEQQYEFLFGDLAVRSLNNKCENLLQGQQRSGIVKVANLGQKPMKVTFKNVTPELNLELSPNPIPAKSSAELSYTITASRSKWGRNYYYATPIVNGKVYTAHKNPHFKSQHISGGAGAMNSTKPSTELGEGKSKIGIWAFTRENFDILTKKERENGSCPSFESTNCFFKSVKAGDVLTATFSVKNIGKEALKIYKTDSDCASLTIADNNLTESTSLSTGKSAKLTYTLDTDGFPKGDFLVFITLVTNSPMRPFINLYISGVVE